ncbi:FYVE-FINGER-CONTAINING RAB5 EFFECTOR PROTEIN RABENOSYN-5-RELATED [Plasmopara halstedii]|uniref:FYVE-FINGER-CONTAINING RAB5 EFFECTOR PROTEIN RABENOSYN-5-RELATED n=1 Tax=Plasmopara halstedii TaxID=4781 RepID=A0A0P1AM40_PLAHL|nr:FYVE-FINGER-CONTAINING RAB5 EFFECTOR PROTEIN RABENOSYN-5-RELATED [Plasmopara halstedii]CEG41969.1 FYVE-FINGER-CONTAINING RAB5 EFFECTOR PROTEIN RABENOSYN-5-RELATED [Plasmopara halstedii]|eukprot:XP_024578338.1 FYVE-FINGER-CONTAINING RAB5 EFFECTOR PROTEIN RABENOSYN-5-RELATED [Plasmopara halstedii]
MVSFDTFATKRTSFLTSMTSDTSVKIKTDRNVSKRYMSPFPPLRLSPMNTVELEGLGQRLVARNMGTFESFLFENQSHVDEDQWKFISSEKNIKAYVQHKRTSESPRKSKCEENSEAEMPILLVTGTIEGDLDDVMYGIIALTTDQMRIKTTYTRDGISRSCILATVTPPTYDAPFNSLCVKWSEWHAPIGVRTITNHRDFVYMEATGFDRLRNGERVGYHLGHSIQFPETPELDTHIRGNSSVNMFYRQRTKNVIDVFIKGFFNSDAGIKRAIIVRSAARTLLTAGRHVHCGRMKRLSWVLRHRYSNGASSIDSEYTENASCSSTIDKGCYGCGKKQSLFLQAANRTNQGAKILKKKRHCQICTRYICLDCRKQHYVTFLLPNQRLQRRLITICQKCELDAFSKSVMTIVRDELLQSDHFLRFNIDDVVRQ